MKGLSLSEDVSAMSAAVLAAHHFFIIRRTVAKPPPRPGVVQADDDEPGPGGKEDAQKQVDRSISRDRSLAPV